MFNAYPHFIDLTVSNRFVVGGGSNAPATFVRNTFQYADDMDLIRGRHHIMFGAEMLAMQMDEVNIGIANGQWTFNGSLMGDANADFLIGRPNLLSVGSPVVVGLRQRYYGAYVQDDVRVSKKLNVHVGVRWEPSLPGHDEFGRGSHFSLPAFIAGQHSAVYSNAPAGIFFNGDAGIPKSFAGSSWSGFAPRVGLAYDPSGKGTQSIRASYGIYYETPKTFTERDLAASAPWGNSIALTAPAGGLSNPFQGYPGGNPYPAPYPPAANAAFPTSGSYINFPLDLHHMSHQQWNLSYQRQLAGNWMVSVAYLGSKATHLRASREQNPAMYIPGASTVANTQQRRLLSQLNPAQGAFYSKITLADDGLNSNYNGLRISAQHRFSHHFTVLSVYTWSHCTQNAETYGNRNGLGGASYQNPYNRNGDIAPCDFDLRQNSATSLVYEVPRFTNRAVDQFLSHWQLGSLFTRHTGFPFTPTTGVDNSLTGLGQDRPNVLGNPYVRNANSLVWVDPAMLVPNALGTFGNAGFNSLIGPSFVNLDANLSRYFQIRERQRFELRFEFFNLFNHTNYNLPVTSRSSSAFGKIQSSGDPRILQFAAKFTF